MNKTLIPRGWQSMVEPNKKTNKQIYKTSAYYYLLGGQLPYNKFWLYFYSVLGSARYQYITRYQWTTKKSRRQGAYTKFIPNSDSWLFLFPPPGSVSPRTSQAWITPHSGLSPRTPPQKGFPDRPYRGHHLTIPFYSQYSKRIPVYVSLLNIPPLLRKFQKGFKRP